MAVVLLQLLALAPSAALLAAFLPPLHARIRPWREATNRVVFQQLRLVVGLQLAVARWLPEQLAFFASSLTAFSVSIPFYLSGRAAAALIMSSAGSSFCAR